MTKSCWQWLGACLISIALSACGTRPTPAIESYVFGTMVSISLPDQSQTRAQQLANAVNQEFFKLHQQLHAWQSDSELSRLNQAIAAGQSMQVTPLLAQMLRKTQQLSAQSEDIFNPAIGQLIALWGFHRDEFTPVKVEPEQIHRLVKTHPSMAQLHIQDLQVSSSNREVQLDFGGYAKGYALDIAANFLRTQGVRNALINIGGNIIALGQHDQRSWQVGIQHPRQSGTIATIDLPDGWAIGTSGDYQRYFNLDGQRYCHIIDPRTGYPVQTTQSVTVLIPPAESAGVMSDVASKPIFIARDESARLLAAKKMGVDYFLIVDAHGDVLMSRAMQKILHWTQPPSHIKVVDTEAL
ncbi:MAG: FAD:protein FMN transferase [Methylophilaceae bacterium]